ncbi:trigger factor [Mesomycoplasma neurolyticum]|uniref:Trigger factor n=1 Tax=Mesomycoplasma neurolyticum TaxID=2120 RepID=A0A449A693_9BACT|nr:trigger factor [Mesomycoplasma neurolyticum]VEU59781.1 Trigger factor [Mesomycoplasma neurolyticum]
MIKKDLLKDSAELKITLEVEKEKWQKALENAKNDLIKNVKIPGFRKGKVPKEKALKLIDPEQILSKAIQKIEKEIIPMMNDQITEKDDVVGNARSFEIQEITLEKLVISGLYPIYPKFELPKYRELKTKYELKQTTDADVEEAINKLLVSKGKMVEYDGPIKESDHAVFDFKGTLDGEEFDGGSAEDFELVIGSKQFVPGFEDGMIGLKKGDKKQLKITFPKEYHSPKLANKEAIFDVEIKKIKTHEKVELNDKFIKELNLDNVSNIEELKKYYKNLLSEENAEKSLVDFQKASFAEIISKVEIPVSKILIEQEVKRLVQTFEKHIKQQGFDLKEFFKITGSTQSKIEEQYREEAIKNLKESFVYIALARSEVIEATLEDYEQEYQKLAKFYKTTADELKNLVTKQQLQIPIINRKVIKRLAEYNSKNN